MSTPKPSLLRKAKPLIWLCLAAALVTAGLKGYEQEKRVDALVAKGLQEHKRAQKALYDKSPEGIAAESQARRLRIIQSEAKSQKDAVSNLQSMIDAER